MSSNFNSSKRILELDGLRGVAILMVLIWHYVTCELPIISDESIWNIFLFPTGLFWTGVDLFFVLSGFLIGGIILDHCREKGFLKVFWIRRSCRILPVYFLTIFLCFFLRLILDENRFSWLFHHLLPFWTYITFTQNIFMGIEGSFGGHFLGVTWSLGVEEQFYIFLPLLALAFRKNSWYKTLLPLIVAAFVLRLAYPGFHTFVVTIFRMDSLLSGCMLALIYRDELIWKKMLACRLSLLSTLIICLLATIYLFADDLFGNFLFSWFVILYSLTILNILIFQGHRFLFLLRSRVLCFFGLISYGLYMYHQAVNGLMHGWLRNGASPFLADSQALLVTFGSAILVVGVSWISLRYFERFFLRLGHRYHFLNTYSDESR